MTRSEALQLAKRELRDGASSIDVIDELQEAHGYSPREAEQIVEEAELDMESEQ